MSSLSTSALQPKPNHVTNIAKLNSLNENIRFLDIPAEKNISRPRPRPTGKSTFMIQRIGDSAFSTFRAKRNYSNHTNTRYLFRSKDLNLN